MPHVMSGRAHVDLSYLFTDGGHKKSRKRRDKTASGADDEPVEEAQ
jgi:hypothetical protein